MTGNNFSFNLAEDLTGVLVPPSSKLLSVKGKFCKDIRDIFFERQKKCYVPCFSTYLMPTRYVIA